MQLQRISNPGGIDDFKLIAENGAEELYLKQLGAAGTLTSRSTIVGTTITFRPISSNSIVSPAVPVISSGKIGKLDFTLRQNQNFVIDLKFKKSDGTPIDLSIYTAIKLQVKSKKSGAAIVPLSIGTGLTIVGDNDVLRVALLPTDTILLKEDQYYHDLLMEDGATNNYYVEGIINVDRTGTR
jgi:hypothetical protein